MKGVAKNEFFASLFPLSKNSNLAAKSVEKIEFSTSLELFWIFTIPLPHIHVLSFETIQSSQKSLLGKTSNIWGFLFMGSTFKISKIGGLEVHLKLALNGDCVLQST